MYEGLCAMYEVKCVMYDVKLVMEYWKVGCRVGEFRVEISVLGCEM